MNARAKKLLEEVLELPREDRAALANDVLASLDEPTEDVEAAWAVEIERRVRDVEEGNVKLIPSEDVFRDARLRLQRSR